VKICIFSGRFCFGEGQPVEKVIDILHLLQSRQEEMAAEEPQTQTTLWESADWSTAVTEVCNHLSSKIYKAKKTTLETDRELRCSITDGAFFSLWTGKM